MHGIYICIYTDYVHQPDMARVPLDNGRGAPVWGGELSLEGTVWAVSSLLTPHSWVTQLQQFPTTPLHTLLEHI